MNTTIQVSHCLKDEQINIRAMTEGINFDNKRFFQTILCKKVVINRWYILVPKVQEKSSFERSEKGKLYQRESNILYGERFDDFPLKYVAKAVDNISLEHVNNTMKFWSNVCERLFPLWNAQSPQSHIATHNSYIVLFRVYETSESLNGHIENRDKRRPSCLRQLPIKEYNPVIDDKEFNDQWNFLKDIKNSI